MIKILKATLYQFTTLIKVKQNLVPAQKSHIKQLSQLNLKDLSLRAKSVLINKQATQDFWLAISSQLLKRLQITTQAPKIRSYANLLYALSKSRNFNLNFETQFSLFLPFASHQSFTMIAISISRMGTFSKQFAFLVKKYYENRKSIFNIRQKVAINYVLTRNNVDFDISILQQIQKMNMKQIVTVLRILDNNDIINNQILQKFAHHIIIRRKQMNIMDLSYAMEIFFKHTYLPQKLEKVFMYTYKILKKNIDEHSFQRIWQYFPQIVNENKINIEFTESIILTMKILYKKKSFTQAFVSKIRKDVRKIENLEIRVRSEIS